MLLTKQQLTDLTKEFKEKGIYDFVCDAVEDPTKREVINTFLNVLTEELSDENYEKTILETCRRLESCSCKNEECFGMGYKESDIKEMSPKFLLTIAEKYSDISDGNESVKFADDEIGLFYSYHKNTKAPGYSVIDNTDKQCWAEDFFTKECAIEYLLGRYESLDELYEYDRFLYEKQKKNNKK